LYDSMDSVKINPDPTTWVCKSAVLTGNVTIGKGTIVHPKCTISAESGPIVIGDNNIIEEQVIIVNRRPGGETLTIGSNNVFEVGASIEAASIGDANIFECRAMVGSQCVVGSGCIVGSGVFVPSETQLGDNEILSACFSSEVTKQDGAAKLHVMLHARHLEILQQTLKQFHHPWTPS